MNINEIINGVKLDITSLTFSEKVIGGVFLAVASMLIVFAILAIISTIISLMYKVFYKDNSRKKDFIDKNKLEMENKEINQNELVPVIIACINQFRQHEDSEIIVRKIIRSNNNYGSWNNGIGGINNDKNL